MEGRLTGSERRVGDFDCIWDDGPVSPETSASQAFLTEMMDGVSLATATASPGMAGSGGGDAPLQNFSPSAASLAIMPSVLSNGPGDNCPPFQAVMGSTPSNRTGGGGSHASLVDLLPLPPLNSFLGCLPMRKNFNNTGRHRSKPRSST